jgi:hypothetical protein
MNDFPSVLMLEGRKERKGTKKRREWRCINVSFTNYMIVNRMAAKLPAHNANNTRQLSPTESRTSYVKAQKQSSATWARPGPNRY